MKQKLSLITFAFTLISCSTIQTTENEDLQKQEREKLEQQTREDQTRADQKKRFAEEEKKRLELLETAKKDREKLDAQEKEKARMAEMQRREEARKAEEKRAAEEQKRTDEKKTAEMQIADQKKEEIKKQEEAARAAAEERERQRILEEQRLAEERRKAFEARQNRLDQIDPDRKAFFRIEMQNKVGSLSCRRDSVIIYRNKRPLQFQGYTMAALPDADIDSPFSFGGKDLADALRGKKGHFVALEDRSTTRPLLCDGRNGSFRIIDMDSDGEGLWLGLEMENSNGEFYKIYTESIPLGR